MTDRQVLAKVNSLLVAGLTLDQADQAAGAGSLSAEAAKNYRFLLEVSNESGASPVFAIRELERLADQTDENQAKIRVSAAVPRATARLVLWLPLGAAILGQLLGLGSVAVFFKSPVAFIALLFGFMLLVGASMWTNRILNSVKQRKPDNHIVVDAIALCLDAGLAERQSIELCIRKFELCFERPVNQVELEELEQLIEFAEQSGAPIAKLLRNSAELNRRMLAHSEREDLEKLSVRLLAPLATLALPAFVLIAVLPISISTLINS